MIMNIYVGGDYFNTVNNIIIRFHYWCSQIYPLSCRFSPLHELLFAPLLSGLTGLKAEMATQQLSRTYMQTSTVSSISWLDIEAGTAEWMMIDVTLLDGDHGLQDL